MADNISINTGTAKAIAADDVSSVFFQKVKLDVGGDGVSSPFTGTIKETTTVGTVTGMGTLAAVGVVHNAGTIAELPDLPGGTIDLVTTVTNLTNGSVAVVAGTIDAFTADIPGGTIDNVGTVVGLGTVANIAVVHNAGTVAELPDLPGGTVDVVTSIANLAKGTITEIENGSIVVTAGTVETTIGDLTGGTIDLITAVGTLTGAGTLAAIGQVHNAGTIAGLPDLPGGTVDEVTSVANLVKGTVTKVEGGSIVVTAGTVETTIGDLTGGTIDLITALTTVSTVAAIGVVHNAGTVAELPDLPGGTVDLLATVTTVGTVTGAGTLAAVGVIHNAGTVAELPDLPGGTVDNVGTVVGLGTIANIAVIHNAGTVAELPDLPGGTVDVVTSVANVAGGTVQIDPLPSKEITTYGTTIGNSGAVGVSLIAAPGAGTSIYLNEVSVTNQGTAPLSTFIGFGTASTLGVSNVLNGFMGANGGGIQKSYPVAVGGHLTNHALLGSITAAGTVNVNISYWIE